MWRYILLTCLWLPAMLFSDGDCSSSITFVDSVCRRCERPLTLIRNIGSGMCLRVPDPSSFSVPLEMVNCNYPATELDRFFVYDTTNGKYLATRWQSVDGSETGDRCAYTGNAEGDTMFTDRCSETNPWHGWDFIDAINGAFLLSHRMTGRCAQQNGMYIFTYVNCDQNDPTMLWRLHKMGEANCHKV